MEGESLINARWNQLGVSSIEHVEIINKEYYQEDVQVIVGPYYAKQRRSIQGVLKSFDLKVALTLPFDLKTEDLSVEVKQSRSLVSDEILVRVGTVDAPKDQLVQTQELQHHTIIIPVGTSIVNPPILDRCLSRKEQNQSHFYHHYTACVEGVRWPTQSKVSWRIRSKVNYATNEVEIVSINDDFVDTARLQHCWSKFVDMMREALCDLRKSLQTNCCRPRKGDEQEPLASPVSHREVNDTVQQQPPQYPVVEDDQMLREQMLRAQMFQQFLRQQQDLLQQQQVELQARMKPAENSS